ncbi:LysR family transcriptional regulator [Luteimonas sp. FCS-9]|uniref:LysR family transcriptional regulator n=1 Tax=Luteimonas sp. FCS-9 TaxID=1547516 RepID=UPI00063E7A94|nr:LysR family transcriptional regulator [Luteimonas sp. FCS-9]KLI97868.1 LysR family transcriptional regulator [Luteimonas sp. FCS-9]
MSKHETLAGLSAFRSVARLGSFTRAADAAGISPSAVSQGVRALEARLGVRLLHRTSRRVTLTEAGRVFLEQIDVPLDRIDIAMQQARAGRGQPSGLLRLNLSRLAAELLVVPRLPAFVARYPDIQVELFTDDTLSDLVAGGFDAGIRLGQSLARDVIARPIGGKQQRIVVGTPGYLRRHGTPTSPGELAAHDCIRFRLPGSGRIEAWRFADASGTFELDVQGRLVFADDRLVREAARDGLGLSRQFVQSIADDLAAGRLVEVLADYRCAQPGFYLYFPARELMAPKLRVFVDFFCGDGAAPTEVPAAAP